MRNWRSEKGTALIEAAVTIPLLVFVCVGIFEFGRAYQTWQVVTNAAREGARLAVLPASNATTVRQRVKDYMHDGQLSKWDSAGVVVDSAASIMVNGTAVTASRVTVNYPFTFITLQPVAKLVSHDSTLGAGTLNMSAQALMRNE
jgi:Flp pilus assembly protein TadG